MYRQYGVKILPLTEIYRQTLYPKPVDLLSIDSEGFGLSILNGLDFRVFRPRMIILEMDNTPGDETLRERLRSNGYQPVQVLGCNEIFERRD
jgi:hypothetical protein